VEDVVVPESRDPPGRQLVEELARERVLVGPATLGGVADLEVKRGRPEQLDRLGSRLPHAPA
jgi:hypothetical protein